MSDIIQLRYGDETIDLTSGGYNVKSVRVEMVEPRIFSTDTDFAGIDLYRVKPNDHLATLLVEITGNSRDELKTRIARLKRLVQGHKQRATRYWLDGNDEPVYLAIERTGSDDIMLHAVKWGVLNDGSDQQGLGHFRYHQDGKTPITIFNVVLKLILDYAGISADTINLKNYIQNPSFAIAAAGTPPVASWTGSGIGTASVSNSYFLVGNCSLFVDFNVGGSLTSSTTAVTSGQSVAGYAWLSLETTGSVAVILLNGGTTISSKTISQSNTANADKSLTWRGKTWYRVPVTGTMSASTTASLQIADAGNGEQCYVGMAYLQVGVAAVPAAWSSYYLPYNRHDPTSTNPERINYIDIWGVPGDENGILVAKYTPNSNGGERLVASRFSDNRVLAADWPVVYDANNKTGQSASAGSWASVADAETHGDAAYRFTSAGTGSGYIVFAINGDVAYQLLARPFVVLVRAKSDDLSSTIRITLTDQYSRELSVPATVSPLTNGYYNLHFVAYVSATNLVPASRPDTTRPELTLTVYVANVANTKYVELDTIWMLPTDGEYMISGKGTGGTETVWLDGRIRANSVSGGVIAQTQFGTLYEVEPGAITNRIHLLMFQQSSLNQQMNINWYNNVTLEVIPRASLLLGDA